MLVYTKYRQIVLAPRYLDQTSPLLVVKLGRIGRLSSPLGTRIRHSAQPGFRLSKNAPIPSGASWPSQHAASSATECAITASSMRGPRWRSSALARATAPGAQDR